MSSEIIVLLIIAIIIASLISVVTGKGLFLGKAPIRMNNSEWYFIKGDQDINPSWPHLHDRNNKALKMDIYTGRIYENGKFIKNLNKKEFKSLWANVKFVEDVKEIRALYPFGEEKLPNIPEI